MKGDLSSFFDQRQGASQKFCHALSSTEFVKRFWEKKQANPLKIARGNNQKAQINQ